MFAARDALIKQQREGGSGCVCVGGGVGVGGGGGLSRYLPSTRLVPCTCRDPSCHTDCKVYWLFLQML